MSDPSSNPDAPDPHDCTVKPVCRKDIYGDKECKCYAQDLDNHTFVCPDGTLNCELSEKTVPSAKADQMCAYEGEDGFLYSCDQRCCNEGTGCPGECDGVPPAQPQGVPTYDIAQQHAKTPDDEVKFRFNLFLKIVLVVVVGIIIINFLIALVYGTSKEATAHAPKVIKFFVAGVNRNSVNRCSRGRK